jgi:hypothetical protein
MKVWRKTKEYPEDKYLVVRRDGTIPSWPHFVLGARDKFAPAALRAYADAAERDPIIDREFISSIRELANDFENYNLTHGVGNPDAPPHRHDDEAVIMAMRHHMSYITVIPE